MLYVSHINKDGTISVKDSVSKQIQHIERELMESRQYSNTPILGVFRYNDGVEIHALTWDNGSDCFNDIIKSIQNDSIREYADIIRHIIPTYIFDIPASSTGKYHPACDAGVGGLKRHLLGVARMLEHLTAPEFNKSVFSREAIDLMKVACLMHDGLKNGWEYEKYTRFDHPLLTAKAIRGFKFGLNEKYIEFIAHCIESHMGEWNTSSYAPGITLPTPGDKYQYLVHLADYIASRNDISMVFDEKVYYKPGQTAINVETISKKETEGLNDKDIADIGALITALDNGMKIPGKFKEILGIEREDEEIKDILNSLITWKTCSEKQKKYVQLAKAISKSNC